MYVRGWVCIWGESWTTPDMCLRAAIKERTKRVSTGEMSLGRKAEQSVWLAREGEIPGMK